MHARTHTYTSNTMAQVETLLRIVCADGTAVQVPRDVSTSMTVLQDAPLDSDSTVEIFDVEPAILKLALDFVARNSKDPIDMDALHGPLQFASMDLQEESKDAQSDENAAASGAGTDGATPCRDYAPRGITPLVHTLDLHVWGLPRWTVEWLDARSTLVLFDLAHAALSLGCDELSSAVCAKLAATYKCIPEEHLTQIDEDLQKEFADAPPPEFEYAMDEPRVNPAIHAQEGKKVQHPLVTSDSAPCTPKEFVDRIENLPVGLFRSVVLLL